MRALDWRRIAIVHSHARYTDSAVREAFWISLDAGQDSGIGTATKLHRVVTNPMAVC